MDTRIDSRYENRVEGKAFQLLARRVHSLTLNLSITWIQI